MSNELASKTIFELAPLLKNKKISPVELTKDILNNINNKQNNVYVDVYKEQAISESKKKEKEIMNNNYKGPLHGIPMGVKNNIYIQNRRATMGSKIHHDFKPNHNASVIERLIKKGVIIIGSQNMHEYAWGGTTENPFYGTCRNPWDSSRTPGGSSGGSAIAVSENMTIFSLGTETLGSLRIPASFCGVVSIKPTYGQVSNFGVFPLAWSLDTVGPISKNVYDASLILENIIGFDKNDLNTIKSIKQRYTKHITDNVEGVVIGIEEDFFFHNVDKRITEIVKRHISKLEKKGAKIKNIKMHTLKDSLYASTIISMSESSTIHNENLLSRPNDFGDDVRAQLYSGKIPSAVEYLQAQQLRSTISTEFSQKFKDVDVLIAPTIPFIPFFIGDTTTILNGKKIEITEHLSRLLRPSTLAGIPAINIPCGFINNLPVGIQVMGDLFQEGKILNVARSIETQI